MELGLGEAVAHLVEVLRLGVGGEEELEAGRRVEGLQR